MTHEKKETTDEAKKATDKKADDSKEETGEHEGMPLDDIKLNKDGGTVDSEDDK